MTGGTAAGAVGRAPETTGTGGGGGDHGVALRTGRSSSLVSGGRSTPSSSAHRGRAGTSPEASAGSV